MTWLNRALRLLPPGELGAEFVVAWLDADGETGADVEVDGVSLGGSRLSRPWKLGLALFQTDWSSSESLPPLGMVMFGSSKFGPGVDPAFL